MGLVISTVQESGYHLRIDWECRPMEILLWLAILLAVGIILWLAAPYHHRIISNRDTVLGKSWEDPML